MIEITPNLAIDERDVTVEFIRATGPGGQNVNKVATAVQLRFDVTHTNFPPGVKQRLTKLAGRRLTDDGILIIEARRYREQERNRQDAMDRLIDLLRKATEKPKTRRKTKPSAAAREKRLKSKHQRSRKKQNRGRVSRYEE